MKLGIAIPLKAKVVSKNWNNVEKSLLQTLNSIKNQKNQNYIAIVVGHDKPSFFNNENKFTDKILFKPFTTLSPPSITNNYEKNLTLFELDRCSKIFEGYKTLIKLETSHFFPLDADDLLSSELVEYVADNRDYDAILIENGYIYYQNKKILNTTKKFSSFCGSSMIAKNKLINKDNESLIFEQFLFRKTGHVMMRSYLDKNDVDYDTPTARLMMYVRDNGDNISRYKSHDIIYNAKRTMKLILRWHFLSASLKEEFTLNNKT